jgi:hypothetical protein
MVCKNFATSGQIPENVYEIAEIVSRLDHSALGIHNEFVIDKKLIKNIQKSPSFARTQAPNSVFEFPKSLEI